MKNRVFPAVLTALAVLTTAPAANVMYAQDALEIITPIACQREIWLKNASDFHYKRDEESMKNYLKNERCYALRLPVEKYIVLSRKMSKDYSIAHILIDGKRLWVEIDGISSGAWLDAED